MDGFLPDGLVWIGFDLSGVSVAASIEYRKPTGRKSVMDGCDQVLLCRMRADRQVFGVSLHGFQIVSPALRRKATP